MHKTWGFSQRGMIVGCAWPDLGGRFGMKTRELDDPLAIGRYDLEGVEGQLATPMADTGMITPRLTGCHSGRGPRHCRRPHPTTDPIDREDAKGSLSPGTSPV